MTKQIPTYKPYGKEAILIEWGTRIEKDNLHKIQNYYNSILKKNIKGIVDINYVYSSLLVIYDGRVLSYNSLKSILEELYNSIVFANTKQSVCFEIPVCYNEKFGLDIDYMSVELDISIQEIIKMHTSVEYVVYGCGFLPGFLYLGGLDPKLELSRKTKPRLKVPKGAVAIGGKQTGIYPMESPGGWNILGNTPIELFNPNQDPPGFVNAGDRIKFKAVDIDEYLSIAEDILQNEINYKQLIL